MTEALYFYCNGVSGTLVWSEVVQQLYSDDASYAVHMLSAAAQETELRTLLPSEELEQGGTVDYSPIRTDAEVARRFHAVAIGLLHRLGFKLSNPLTGTFEMLEERDTLALRLHSDIFNDIAGLARERLVRIMESLAVCGFFPYAAQIYNSVAKLYYARELKKRPVQQWFQGEVMQKMARLMRIYAAQGPSACLVGVPAPESYVEPSIEAPVEGMSPVPSCDHGVIMTPIDQKRLGCIAYKEPSGNCNAVRPIR